MFHLRSRPDVLTLTVRTPAGQPDPRWAGSPLTSRPLTLGSAWNRKWLHGPGKVRGKVAAVTSPSLNDPFSTRTEARRSGPELPLLLPNSKDSVQLRANIPFAFCPSCSCYSAAGCKISESLGINKEMHPSILVNSPEHTLDRCVFMEEPANCSVILEIC